MTISNLSTRSFAILALGASLAAGASAQSYYKRSLPDYDQRRSLLPGKGGMYCVPTSYVNLMKFMAWNGMPGMDAAYGDGYASVTSFINQIGMNMNTDPVKGTGGAAYGAMVDWVNDHTNVFVLNFRAGGSTYWGPSAMQNLVGTGAMVSIAYGRYHQIGATWKRESGHAVSLAGYDWRFATKKLLVADPAADDGDNTMQGPFVINEKATAITALINTNNQLMVLPRYDTTWSGSDGTYQAVVDYMHGILPIWAGWFTTPVATSPSAKSVKAMLLPAVRPVFHASFPFQLEDGINPAVKNLDVELPGPISDWCMDHGDIAIMTLGTDGVVSHVDLVSKAITRLGSFPGARKLVVAGAGLDVYVLMDNGREDKLVRIERNTGKQTSFALPKGATSIEPNPNTRGILALYPVQKAVVSIDEELRGSSFRSVELPDGQGEPMMAVEKNGTITLGRAGANTLIRMTLTGTPQRILLNAPMALRDFQSAGNGFFLAQDGERLVTLDANGKPARSQFDGLSIPARVRFAQSWDAVKPEDISGPGWDNVLPVRGQP